MLQSSVKKKRVGQARPNVCVVVASPLTVQAFLREHLKALSRSAKVTVVADTPNRRFLRLIEAEVDFHPVSIRRAIDPWNDLSAFLILILFFRSHQFDLVQSYTPKAGLLAMSAAFFAGIHKRVHTFTGQVWATKKGLFRILLKNIDRITARLATHILVDSPSQMRFLRSERVLPWGKGEILGPGSVSGVDLSRFRPNPFLRKKVRQRLGLAKDAVTFLFVGRLNRDKGLPELYEAFRLAREKIPNAQLILVGPEEEKIPLPAGLIGSDTGVVHVGPSSRPEEFMASAEVLVLPSHREGFGSTVIEANACGIPVVASRIYGLTDAVVHGQTGLLVTPGKVFHLFRAMVKVGSNTELRQQMGLAGLKRVKKEFCQKSLTNLLLKFYKKLGLNI